MAQWRFAVVLLLAAALLFGGLAALLHRMETRALAGAGIDDQLTPTGRVRPIAEVAQALRQAKLVTVEINTRVVSESSHESWRGDVVARVEAPVRILYGTDLSRMTADSIAYSPVTRAYLVRIPQPERIATEVAGSDEDLEVQIGWLRLRSRAGEYRLGLARRDLYERAREITLSPADAAMVRRATLEQVTVILRRLIGDKAGLEVVYLDGGGA